MIKWKFLFILLLFPLQDSLAQTTDYWPILEKGKRWCYDCMFGYYFKGEVTYYVGSSNEDAPFPPLDYLYENLNGLIEDEKGNLIPTDSTHLFAYINEMINSRAIRNLRFYPIMEERCHYLQNWTVLFDFCKQPEDGIIILTPVWSIQPYPWVKEYDAAVTVRGRKTRVHVFKAGFKVPSPLPFYQYNDKRLYWFEGLGSLDGILPVPPYSGGYSFRACYQDDKLLATREDLQAVVDSLEGKSSVRRIISQDVKNGKYDLHGRQLNDEPAKGLLIQNGKKVVIK